MAMGRRGRALLGLITIVVVFVALILVFPKALAFVELAARELRYFWWLILMVALGVWLVWGWGRPKRP